MQSFQSLSVLRIELAMVSTRNEAGLGLDHSIAFFDDEERSTANEWHLRGVAAESD